MSTPTKYRFTFGPWNISTGADPFGPPARKEMEYARKLKTYKELGFDGVQFHDDDIVPADLDWQATLKGTAEVKKILDGEGLFVEIIAPRLWEDPRTLDGGFTSNDPKERQYAIDRAKRCADLANEVGCKNYVLWLAREGTYIREAKCAKTAVARIVDAWSAILEHNKDIRILGEAKPNEPTDSAYIPTVGHMMAIGYKTVDPARSGVLIESAHSLLAGLDPSDDMAFALYHGKLWSVHLNDQNGLKYDQDKTFGSVNLRQAFNQVWVLDKNGFGQNGECVGLDVKAMRTTTFEDSLQHLSNSKTMFLRLLDVVRAADEKKIEELRAAKKYEQLDLLIMNMLMGKAG
ncbi:TIM barrel protein [Planctomyces sp. SH-PL62]|uniref:TIM barrel protein n=1 Tax=Planctomyces sp. SH-PL62 TaxID=1636152 RepID=UPI00078DCDF7|nr:TIM barrel protein [Planctomyces sp. SH-PL62]AMV40132.1 Xylose isomerase [Planctomyces sp. SH-PL62]